MSRRFATGIAGAAPHALGAPYEDASGRTHARLLGQPIDDLQGKCIWIIAGISSEYRAGLIRAVYVARDVLHRP